MKVSVKSIAPVFFLLPIFVAAQDTESIEWSPEKRLSWSDYMAKPLASSEAAAITSTAIGIEYHVLNNKFGYSITCRFSKTKSWGKYKTEYILEHEQGHFDITEIFARRLAKELKKYKFNPRNYQEDVNTIYKRLMVEKEEYQDEYDKETDFSRNKEKQSEWLAKIREELEATDDYANYQATVNI